MNTTLVAIVTSTAFASVITKLIDVFLGQRLERKALQILLLDKIKAQGKAYVADGHISTEELKEYHEAYDTYKKLGGNGYADDIYAKVKALPFEVGDK